MRQLLNVAYSIMAEGRDDGALEQLDMELGMTEDPAAEAKAALAEHQRRAGMTFADPDAPVAARARDDVPGWMTADEEF